MDSYLENPFHLDSFGSSSHAVGSHRHGHAQGSSSLDHSGAPLSPMTLSRLQTSWNQSQSTGNGDASQDIAAGSSSPSNAHQLSTLSTDFDNEFGIFSSSASHLPSSTLDMGDSYVLGRNTLGLLDNDPLLHFSPHTSSGAVDMQHTQSASGILDSSSHNGGPDSSSPLGLRKNSTMSNGVFDPSGPNSSPTGRPLQRSASISSPAYVTARNGSISASHHFQGVQHPSRQDFSIGQSPKSSFATPSHNTPARPSGLAQHPQQSPFDPQNHQGLLSLSQGGGSSQHGSMGPPTMSRGPAMDLAKRGLFNTNGDDKDSTNQEEDSTPLASSMGTFAGQRPALGQVGTNPSTPFTARHGMFNATPGSSVSSTTTPDDPAVRSWMGSPFTPMTAPGSERPGIQRMHSIDGSMAGHHVPTSMQSFNQPLDAFWSDREDNKPGVSGRSGLGLSGSSSQDGVNGGLSLFHRRAQQNAMSRVTSAPSLAPLSISTGAVQGSVPSTPSDCPPGSAASWASSIPSTPGDVGLSLSPGFNAVGMSHSRSMGGMGSTMSPINVSCLSLQDGGSPPYATPGRGSFSEMSGSPTHGKTMNKGRSNSKSTGTTPRKAGGRASGAPPPLVVSSADKVHVCHCGKRFKRLEHLKRHNRTHTQERPHKCPVDGCGKYFGRTDNLAQHLKTHFRATGLARASQQLYAMSNVQGGEAVDLRHDPHAAAAQAAAAAMQAVNGKRRSSTISHPGGSSSGSGSGSGSGSPDSGDILGGPISLTKQGQQQQHDGQQFQSHHLGQQEFQHQQQQQQQQQQHYQQHGDRSVLTSSASANASPHGAYTLSAPFAM